MQRLVARACLGVNGDDDRSVRESNGARQHPSSKAMDIGRVKTLGYSEHGDETPFTLRACLSLNLHSCAEVQFLSEGRCPNFCVDIVWLTWRNVTSKELWGVLTQGLLENHCGQFPCF